MSEKRINDWLKNGDKHGEEYEPWLRIQDVPSLGRVHRIKGIKTNRIHNVLSDLEARGIYIADFSDYCTDIREQYPMWERFTKAVKEDGYIVIILTL